MYLKYLLSRQEVCVKLHAAIHFCNFSRLPYKIISPFVPNKEKKPTFAKQDARKAWRKDDRNGFLALLWRRRGNKVAGKPETTYYNNTHTFRIKRKDYVRQQGKTLHRV